MSTLISAMTQMENLQNPRARAQEMSGIVVSVKANEVAVKYS